MIADEAQARAWVAGLPEGDGTALRRLDRLAELLAEENSRQNLVSASSLIEVWRRHVADSAQLLALVPRETGPWLDLGTGAGFPGLVVASLRPTTRVVMVESRKRRCEWLSRAAVELGLDQAEVVCSPLERVEAFPAAVISARAFAPLDRLLAVAARFSTNETLWLLPKGRSARQELDSLRGYRHMFHVEQSLTDADAGIVMGRLLSPGREKRA